VSAQEKPMTKGEREELKRLARERARVAKHDAQSRTADLKAMFEHQLADAYSFNSEENWSSAVQIAREECASAQERIEERCKDLGIPLAMHPLIQFDWQSRGPDAVAGQQQNLRRAAHQRIAAQERAAIAEIDRAALEIQTQLVRAGLTSDTAIEFLLAMPSVNDLMPPVNMDELGKPNERRQLGMGDDDIAF
jgi:hypothetical protein